MRRQYWLGGTSGICYGPNDGTAGGGVGTSTDGGTGTGAEPKERTDGGGGDGTGGEEDFLGSNKALWDNPVIETDPVKEEARNRQRAEADKRNDTNLRGHIEKFDPGFQLDDAALEALQNKDPTGLTKAINTSLRATMYQMYRDVTKMIQGGLKDVRGEMDTAARRRLAADRSEQTLYEALPFTRNEAIRPIATAIKAQFLRKGKTDSEANDAVKNYFKATAQLGADDLGLDTAPRGRPGERGNSRRNGRAEEEVDWAAIMRGD